MKIKIKTDEFVQNLDKIRNWAFVNQMKINCNESKAISFYRRQDKMILFSMVTGYMTVKHVVVSAK